MTVTLLRCLILNDADCMYLLTAYKCDADIIFFHWWDHIHCRRGGLVVEAQSQIVIHWDKSCGDTNPFLCHPCVWQCLTPVRGYGSYCVYTVYRGPRAWMPSHYLPDEGYGLSPTPQLCCQGVSMTGTPAGCTNMPRKAEGKIHFKSLHTAWSPLTICGESDA